ncbi:MAG: hypothetical protein A2117_01930 [Candidatus Wildermuthbacteria bacterium GWA2_46_15]|uniref:DUF4446 domain-containing protein n=1 Tax=Candidatus Wildermuthbacteria bacterium GWA2_46_15 TaxID=1802443 RepID=A0A1G2QNG8_9BACT|nr:MAG: hypothetical protein A2117_01930 [Candidatus Wildermuthbacteria bacterium GWA2_46_15]
MFNLFRKNKKEPENLEGVLKKLKILEVNLGELSRELEELKAQSRLFFKKVGFIRYNPFLGVGGDQSFSLALLDENNDGIVITSLFSREGNRVYAKTVEKGQSSYPLSEEEKQAIEKAKGS